MLSLLFFAPPSKHLPSLFRFSNVAISANKFMENSDFTRFIEFGNIFDRPTREYLVQYIQQKIKPEKQTIFHDPPESERFDYLKDALDNIFAEPKMLELAQKNEQVANEIIKDTLKWMRQAEQERDTDNPHQEEQKELERWHTRPSFMWVRHWYKLTNYLRDIYTQSEINTKFYEQKFEELTRPINAYELERNPQEGSKTYAQELARLEVLIDDLLAHWQALLTAKRLAYELEYIDRQREQFCELLYAKVEEFLKLLDIVMPFQEEVGHFWDMSRGLWQETGFDVLKKYADLLEQEDKIRALADMLGRLREAEIELEEERFEQVLSKKSWRQDLTQKSEIGGVYEGKELSKVLPSEVSLLGYPETESVFLKKYAEGKLLSFQEQGQKLVHSDEINYFTQQKERKKERGPFILCIDTSGSMEGTPEQIAKVLCFAILKMAAREQRNCFLISFSIGIKTINLLDLANSLDEVVKFLSMSFHGGTDATPALMATLNMLESKDYQEADVLMVSDFVMFDIKDEVLRKIHQEKQKGTNFHSLTISKQANPEIIQEFDHNWLYNPDERGVIKQLAQDLREIYRLE